MNLLEQILRKIFCLHEWEEKVKHVQEYNHYNDVYTFIYACKHCGKFKKITL